MPGHQINEKSRVSCQFLIEALTSEEQWDVIIKLQKNSAHALFSENFAKSCLSHRLIVVKSIAELISDLTPLSHMNCII